LLLQNANCRFERQALRLQKAGGAAAPFADHGGEDNGPVHMAAPALQRGSRGIVEYPLELDRHDRVWLPSLHILAGELIEKPGEILVKACDVNVAGREHGCRLFVAGESEKKMLETDLAMLPAAGMIGRSRKRGRKHIGQ
jgi:hypothetical protein